MANSNRWFTYTSDNAQQWAIFLDESNTEGANGAAAPGAPATTVFKPPANLKPRYAVYGNEDGTRSIRAVILTVTAYNALSASSTIPDIDGDGTLSLIRKRPEVITPVPTIFDTGLNDGD